MPLPPPPVTALIITGKPICTYVRMHAFVVYARFLPSTFSRFSLSLPQPFHRLGLLEQALVGLVLPVVGGRHGHARLRHDLLGGGLGAHRLEGADGGSCGRDQSGEALRQERKRESSTSVAARDESSFDRKRTDEDDARVPAHLGELGVLRQEAVPRVQGLGPRALRHAEDLLLYQVGFRGGRRPDPVRLVGLFRFVFGRGKGVSCEVSTQSSGQLAGRLTSVTDHLNELRPGIRVAVHGHRLDLHASKHGAGRKSGIMLRLGTHRHARRRD